jgi:hypothetical protein
MPVGVSRSQPEGKAIGLRRAGFRQPLAFDATAGVAFQFGQTFARIRELQNLGAQYRVRLDTQSSPVHSSSLPFCVRFNAAVARRAATLDTGPVASSNPRAISHPLVNKPFPVRTRSTWL